MLGCASLLLSSCMTIFTGTTENILVNRDTTEPVTIVTADDTIVSSDQPISLRLKKKHLNQPIHFSSPHYRYQSLIPGRKVDWLGAYFDLYSCGIGLAVDAGTGALYHPAEHSYYIAAVSKDSTEAQLPVNDRRVPSLLKPRCSAFYHHELRLQGSLGMDFNNSSYNDMRDRVCTELKMQNNLLLDLGLNAAIGLAYFYHFDERWAAGLSVGTSRREADDLVHYSEKDANGERHNEGGTMHCTAWYLLPAAKCHWLFFSGCRLYTKVSAGLLWQHNWFSDSANTPPPPHQRYNERGCHLAYQFSPLCIEVGKTHLHAFAELGYGMEGIFSAGISYHF